MKEIIIVVTRYCLVLILLTPSFGQVKRESSEKPKIASQQKKTISNCSENPDKLYNRQKLFEKLADILNESVPEYAKVFKQRFAVENERGNSFFVYDLTDPSNNPSMTACIDFKNNHIYHFAPQEFNFSFSHILILEDGKLKVFRSIDCWNRGDKLEDVISYVSKKLENNKDKDEIIERIKNFRKYGFYFYEDELLIPCKGYETSK
jgi:hypothetical protein